MVGSNALHAARLEDGECRIGVPWAVDQIADTKHGFDAHRFQRIEDSLECLRFAVNVADDPQPAEHARVAHKPNLGAFGRVRQEARDWCSVPLCCRPAPCSTCDTSAKTYPT